MFTPKTLKANQPMVFTARSTTGFQNVQFQVCTADGQIRKDHFDGPDDAAAPTITWEYVRTQGLPEGSAQAQFLGRHNGSAIEPRAVLDLYIPP